MATNQQLEDLKKEIAEIESQISGVNAQIANLNNEAELYRQAAGVALNVQKQALANAKRILGVIAAVEQDTNVKLAEQQQEAKTLANGVLNTAQQMLKATERYTDERIAVLRRKLDEVRDPVSGELWPLERVLDSFFEVHRDDALRADEYDAMGYPGAAYDDEQVEAHLYDLYGKLLLTAWYGAIDELTAEEYDALLLTAEAFGIYGLSAAKYDLSAKSFLV